MVVAEINDDAAFRNDPSHRLAGAHVYTAFCRAINGKGSTWISAIDADDVETAREEAVAQCAFEWQCPESDVECIGIAEGNVRILEWAEGK